MLAIKDQQGCRTHSGLVDPKVSVADLALTWLNSPVRTEMSFLSVVGCPWLDSRGTQKLLHHPPPQLDRGEEIQQKARGSR